MYSIYCLEKDRVPKKSVRTISEVGSAGGYEPISFFLAPFFSLNYYTKNPAIFFLENCLNHGLYGSVDFADRDSR